MKKVLFLAVIAIATIGCKDNASSKIKTENIEVAKQRDAKIALGSAKIEFDQTNYDFGTITEGEIIDGVFKLKNTGKADLVIVSARATCGCTVPEWPKEAIKPGESSELKFTFNSRGRSGKQTKSITLKTNTGKVTETLRISGMVEKKS
ncbi:DUF1573 domain-containing protein [Lutibacter sp. TH_r2]|uniref:DUF1573 domain-containing protein n=1 Tax=Lutibacter sp. TH_r2 TaxID=3082083 RepID=UPI002954D25F|nr:DUF1573 domain-containing protein [Lutibacter sp. TH_r2]MDV7188118.1 DUF1573 domain-containing protein [Lutibacter sp. TH_r2]